ncbi:hypothetical protein [Absidia glauca]|uniref:MADS-box domain-containing protein n=1 Tax=Absidia glauca TaxID=4829 RepID=A0A163JZJ2_ABSGL|nr:hypothetical protein [Absidia glauca]
MMAKEEKDIIEQDPEQDSEDSTEVPRKRNSGRRKIKIEYIEDKNRRHITFSKRKAGIMKKAYELSTLTGTQVLLLVVSETGLVYTFTTVKLQPIVTKPEGKSLIQACLNAPDPGMEGAGLLEENDTGSVGSQKTATTSSTAAANVDNRAPQASPKQEAASPSMVRQQQQQQQVLHPGYPQQPYPSSNQQMPHMPPPSHHPHYPQQQQQQPPQGYPTYGVHPQQQQQQQQQQQPYPPHQQYNQMPYYSGQPRKN